MHLWSAARVSVDRVFLCNPAVRQVRRMVWEVHAGCCLVAHAALGGRKRVCLLQYASAAHTLLVRAGPIILCQRVVYKADVPSPTMLLATTCLQLDITGKSMQLPRKSISKACPWDVLLVSE